ncbi:hypothetical protein [Chryseobacterium sp. 2R14A]|uniref:hypothetical protein n=1 Tax=Chryseobacterium sp. 2R14A TaxID=3380353 RepID=UPI003CE7FBC5
MKINKDVLYGFIAVLLISGFTIINIVISKQSSAAEIAEIQKVQKAQKEDQIQSKLSEKAADLKRDSALSVLGRQTTEMFYLRRDFNSLSSNVLNLKTIFNENFNQLKNIQNEKDHVTDAPVSEQLDFITKYRYKEY